jgi:lipopolysaccharide assembly outer membrane protein LptD (OstA)
MRGSPPRIGCATQENDAMRILVLCVGVFGLVLAATFQSHRSALRESTIAYGPSTTISATELRHEARTNTVYARGRVRIDTPSSTITADEADIHHLRDTRAAVDLALDLRGNVRVLIPPAAQR